MNSFLFFIRGLPKLRMIEPDGIRPAIRFYFVISFPFAQIAKTDDEKGDADGDDDEIEQVDLTPQRRVLKSVDPASDVYSSLQVWLL